MPLFGISSLPPFTGNVFWVNESTGSDGNSGGPYDPLGTLSQAHTLCTSGNNDVVLLTGTIHTTATTTWSKSKTHLIGLAPNLQSNARARISQTGSTVFTPLVSVTGSECIFLNVGAFHGFANASTQICWADTGERNSYEYCSFLGMANATAGAQAGGRSLTVGGAGGTGENTFFRCQVGLDTITRSTSNASLEFLNGTPRNTFRECIFPVQTSSASALFVKAASASVDRWQWFQDCLFVNNIKSASTAMTVGFSMGAGTSPAGLMMLQRCSSIGATAWGDTAALGQMYIDGAPPTAATSGLAVNPA
jgi:hypothetical protein